MVKTVIAIPEGMRVTHRVACQSFKQDLNVIFRAQSMCWG